MSFQIITDLKELDEVSSIFRDSSTFDFSLAGAKDEIQNILSSSFEEIFEQQGAVGGHPVWEQLKDTTKKQKQRLNYGGKKILERTGALREAYTHPQVFTEDNGRRLVVKFSGEHADLIAIHNAGTRDGRLHARELVFITDETRDKIAQAALGKFVENFKKKLGARRR